MYKNPYDDRDCDNIPDDETCPTCKDSPVAGTIWVKRFIDDGMGTETECPTCHGTGYYVESARNEQ